MLATHPEILEAAVVAVADSHWGERPKAFITVQAGKDLKGADVIDWAKHESGISKFMVPREVEVVKELPKTSTGKLKKNVLREWAKGGERSMDSWRTQGTHRLWSLDTSSIGIFASGRCLKQGDACNMVGKACYCIRIVEWLHRPQWAVVSVATGSLATVTSLCHSAEGAPTTSDPTIAENIARMWIRTGRKSSEWLRNMTECIGNETWNSISILDSVRTIWCLRRRLTNPTKTTPALFRLPNHSLIDHHPFTLPTLWPTSTSLQHHILHHLCLITSLRLFRPRHHDPSAVAKASSQPFLCKRRLSYTSNTFDGSSSTHSHRVKKGQSTSVTGLAGKALGKQLYEHREERASRPSPRLPSETYFNITSLAWTQELACNSSRPSHCQLKALCHAVFGSPTVKLSRSTRQYHVIPESNL